jgi:hypothetical protein
LREPFLYAHEAASIPILLVTVACCRAAPILQEEAKDRIGENTSVRGLVEQVSFSKKPLYVPLILKAIR